MKIKYISVDELKPYEFNPKEHNEEQVDAIASSIKRFGFTQPIVIDKNNEIVAGHGRLMGAQKLGLKEVPTLSVDQLTEEEVIALRMADNNIQAMTSMSIPIQEGEIIKIQDPELIEIAQLDKILVKDEFNWKGKEVELGEEGKGSNAQRTCPNCGFEI